MQHIKKRTCRWNQKYDDEAEEGISKICCQVLLGHNDIREKDWKGTEQIKLGAKGRQIAATDNISQRVQKEKDSSRYIS